MASKRENGIAIGVVKSLEDPENLGRVKVSFPLLEDQESHWARLVAPLAGKERGWFLRPEVDDEVLVAFEHGDPRQPYVVGGVWSQTDPPPADDGDAKANNQRFFRSRTGHQLTFDDTSGGEKVEIVSGDGKNRFVIDQNGSKLRVESDQGDIEVKAPQGAVKVEAVTIELKASGSITVEASGTLTLKGATVAIN